MEGTIHQTNLENYQIEFIMSELVLHPDIYIDQRLDVEKHCKAFDIFIQNGKYHLANKLCKNMKPGLIHPSFYTSIDVIDVSRSSVDDGIQSVFLEKYLDKAIYLDVMKVPMDANSFISSVSFHRTGGLTYREDLTLNVLRSMIKYRLVDNDLKIPESFPICIIFSLGKSYSIVAYLFCRIFTTAGYSRTLLIFQKKCKNYFS